VARDYDLLAAAITERFGRLDGLVHIAGILGALAPLEHFEVPTWCRVLHVNLTAAFALTQVLLPALRAAADGSIVFTSSGVARHPKAYWGAYAVSKAGIETLAAMLAQEVEDSSPLRVNVLNPGPVRTRMRAQAYPAEDPRALAGPADIVGPYLWLLSAASRGVTGQSLDCQAARPAPPG
jgi:NAD(P)-dependent dehydrogenase (short-subunit alcohol dehydrogenase family)